MLELIRRLADQKVEFVLVGGMAAAAYGSTVLTRAVGVCCPFDEQTLERVCAAVRALNPRLRQLTSPPAAMPPALELLGASGIYLDTDVGSLDLVGNVAGVGAWDEVRRRSTAIELWGLPIRVLSLEALRASMRALGRPMDLLVLQELELAAQPHSNS